MNTALILMSGRGERFGKQTPKQFYLYNGVPLFVYTVRTFNACQDIDNIVLVSDKDHLQEVNDIIIKEKLDKVSHVVPGGKYRAESAFNGLKVIQDEDIVLIHDACRIFVNERIIVDNIKQAKKKGNAITAIKVVDTISFTNDGEQIEKILDRNHCYLHQTPQTFTAKFIKECYQKIKDPQSFSDEASLLMYLGYPVYLIPGSSDNIKITNKEDLLFLHKLK